MNVAVLAASPRPDGNSRAMADALVEGSRGAGHTAQVFDLNEWTDGFIRDCRTCRRADGECSIDDRFRELLFEHVMPADALVYATPLYWYGMAASLKNWFDRVTCYISVSYPRSAEVMDGISGKRVALLIAAEERYPGSTLPMIGQVQEVTRYLSQKFVGVVHGVGNQRGEVRHDPSDPLAACARLGAALPTLHYSDYRLYSERSGSVWGEEPEPKSTYGDT